MATPIFDPKDPKNKAFALQPQPPAEQPTPGELIFGQTQMNVLSDNPQVQRPVGLFEAAGKFAESLEPGDVSRGVESAVKAVSPAGIAQGALNLGRYLKEKVDPVEAPYAPMSDFDVQTAQDTVENIKSVPYHVATLGAAGLGAGAAAKIFHGLLKTGGKAGVVRWLTEGVADVVGGNVGYKTAAEVWDALTGQNRAPTWDEMLTWDNVTLEGIISGLIALKTKPKFSPAAPSQLADEVLPDPGQLRQEVDQFDDLPLADAESLPMDEALPPVQQQVAPEPLPTPQPEGTVEPLPRDRALPGGTGNTIGANLTVATEQPGSGIPMLYEAAKNGDQKAAALLNQYTRNAIGSLVGDIPGVKIEFDDGVGVYTHSDGTVVYEPSTQAYITFDPANEAEVLSGLETFRRNFAQEEIHVLSPTTTPDAADTVFVYEATLTEALEPQAVYQLADQAGLQGLSVRGNRLEFYNAGGQTDEQFDDAVERFIFALREQGAFSTYSSRAARLRSIGSGSDIQPRAGDNSPQIDHSFNPDAVAAGRYLTDRRFKPNPQRKADKRRVALQESVADEYDALPVDDSSNRNVRKAYDQATIELQRQWSALPVRVEVYQGKGEPYKSSDEMRRDVRENNHLYILKTDAETFGPTDAMNQNHPFLKDSGHTDINGVPLLYNDVFRAIHDWYAHTASKTGFGESGEYAGWLNHMAATKDPWARWAFTTETMGQNSWVNRRQGLDQETPYRDRGFAEQKFALLPLERVLTGDKKVDKEVLELMSELPRNADKGSLWFDPIDGNPPYRGGQKQGAPNPYGEGIVDEIPVNRRGEMYSRAAELTPYDLRSMPRKAKAGQFMELLEKMGSKKGPLDRGKISVSEINWIFKDTDPEKAITRDEALELIQKNNFAESMDFDDIREGKFGSDEDMNFHADQQLWDDLRSDVYDDYRSHGREFYVNGHEGDYDENIQGVRADTWLSEMDRHDTNIDISNASDPDDVDFDMVYEQYRALGMDEEEAIEAADEYISESADQWDRALNEAELIVDDHIEILTDSDMNDRFSDVESWYTDDHTEYQIYTDQYDGYTYWRKDGGPWNQTSNYHMAESEIREDYSGASEDSGDTEWFTYTLGKHATPEAQRSMEYKENLIEIRGLDPKGIGYSTHFDLDHASHVRIEPNFIDEDGNRLVSATENQNDFNAQAIDQANRLGYWESEDYWHPDKFSPEGRAQLEKERPLVAEKEEARRELKEAGRLAGIERDRLYELQVDEIAITDGDLSLANDVLNMMESTKVPDEDFYKEFMRFRVREEGKSFFDSSILYDRMRGLGLQDMHQEALGPAYKRLKEAQNKARDIFAQPMFGKGVEPEDDGFYYQVRELGGDYDGSEMSIELAIDMLARQGVSIDRIMEAVKRDGAFVGSGREAERTAGAKAAREAAIEYVEARKQLQEDIDSLIDKFGEIPEVREAGARFADQLRKEQDAKIAERVAGGAKLDAEARYQEGADLRFYKHPFASHGESSWKSMNSRVIIKRALDEGADGILIPRSYQLAESTYYSGNSYEAENLKRILKEVQRYDPKAKVEWIDTPSLSHPEPVIRKNDGVVNVKVGGALIRNPKADVHYADQIAAVKADDSLSLEQKNRKLERIKSQFKSEQEALDFVDVYAKDHGRNPRILLSDEFRRNARKKGFFIGGAAGAVGAGGALLGGAGEAQASEYFPEPEQQDQGPFPEPKSRQRGRTRRKPDEIFRGAIQGR